MSEFFEGPKGLYGEDIHPQAAAFYEITPEIGLFVLCCEPGLGKTTELELVRDNLATCSRDNERLIHLKAREFESFLDLQSHLDGHPDWQTWLSGGVRLTILFDGLDEGFIRMPTLVARLRGFLETKPTNRLRVVLSCRSFEWPEGCWNSEIKTGAKDQLLGDYLRPFARTHGIFLVAWFHSPDCAKLAPNQSTELSHVTPSDAKAAICSLP